MTAVPVTDPRRAQALRAALAQMAPWLAPEWAGLGQEGDFGAALYEIAARLAEHGTRRLDQTALRDQLAFLDALDIAAPAPRSATVPIVFMLAEKRAEPVYAPPRVQIAATGDDGPVIFETREAIEITPARPLRLIAADPSADRIELAPANVIAPPQRSEPPTTYRLVSAAEPGGTMLQLAQAVGLAAGDLLRIAGTAYRIAKRSGEIVTLLDPLESPAAAGAAVEKVTRLDSFRLRNLGGHIAYIGHKELLKLDGPAILALRLDPPDLVRRLTQLDIAYDLWGKREGVTGWQELRLLGGRDGDLRLSKDWEGAVEEVEVEARKSRWLRLRLLTPIADAAPPDTRAASVALKVNSVAPAGSGPKESSRSIVSAFYNGLPLPLTTAFLPFGPEPQRFDTFAIAAPEALSKKGATVELEVALSDSSLVAMTLAKGAPERVYGIGRNSRLQAIRFLPGEPPAWRQLDRPPAVGGGTGPQLDGQAPFLALHSPFDPANDLVLVTDTGKRLWLARVGVEGGEREARKWSRTEEPRQEPPNSLCLLGDPALATPSLVASDSAGVYARTIDLAGLALGEPQDLRPHPGGLKPADPLVLSSVAGSNDRLVAIDKAGKLFSGIRASDLILWTELPASKSLKPEVPPAAFAENGMLTVAAAAASGEVLLVRDDEDRSPTTNDPIVRPFSLACLPPTDEQPFSLVVAAGPEGILVWADEMLAPLAALPLGAAGGAACALLRPRVGKAPPSLLIGAPDELLLEAPITSSFQTFQLERSDTLWLGSAASDALYFEPDDGAAQPLPPQRLAFGGARRAVPIPLGAVAMFLRLLIPRDEDRTGARIGHARKLMLEPDDTATRVGDTVEIGGALATVIAIDLDLDERRVASFDADLPSRFTKYRSLKRSDPVAIAVEDRGTLLRLSGANFPKEPTSFRFASPASPRRQTFARASNPPAGETWLRLGSAWTTPPSAATLSLPSLTGISIWTQVRLPRSTENPELSWEYFDGRGWRRLDSGFRDGTANLASTGTISFEVPDDLAPADVAGKQDYWIRARLVGGDYGRPSYIVDTSVPNRQSISVDRSSLNPPEIVTIEASYELKVYAPAQLVLTVNNLAPMDQTQAADAGGAEFDLFEGLAAHTGDLAGLGKAIYLGLTRAPDVSALSLYLDVAEIDAPASRLRAEVLRPEGWAPITCDDKTAGLSRPGLLRLFLATAPAQLPLFGCACWWVRLRLVDPAGAWAPIVRGLYLNAVTAEQAKSLRQEILGSSLGAPGQSYRLAETPVLPETLELRVRESLSDEEKRALAATDPASVASYADVEGEWTRWRATDSFVDQGGGARVFRLDPSSGEIRFGNGHDGRIPPAGRDSIRAVGYQTGGGSHGNLAAFAVNQLKTALESVDLAVNPVDSGGGADAPPKDRLAETAPARLRHATRALTPPDIEALATGSSPDVVRARCLRGRGCGIDLVVAIRNADERCPMPSLARREGIARNIAAAGWGALAPDAIHVRGPRYVHVKVEALVIARAAEGVAQVENDVRKAIVDFLHPIDGGPRGLGWPFGRRPWPSDVQRVAAAVAGVDRVVDVAIAALDAAADLERPGPDTLFCAEEDDVSLVVQPPRGTR